MRIIIYITAFIGLFLIQSCSDEISVAPKQGVATDKDGDGIENDSDSCPEEAGPIENNGCPWPETNVGKITFPDDKQSCINLPITVKFTSTNGGSGRFNYRYLIEDLTDSSVPNKTSDWRQDLFIVIDNDHLEKDHIYSIKIESFDIIKEELSISDAIRFHVRGEEVSTYAPPVAVWITPSSSGGSASEKIEWSNIENLTYDILINGVLKAQNITEKEYTHNLTSGAYTVVVRSINQSGYSSTTAPYGFVVN